MIPKIIHYCWLGDNPMPEEFQGYLVHWKEVMPDWQIIGWTDANVKDLIRDRKWDRVLEWGYADKKRLGFLSDLVRYTALVEYGGFYVDTDVEILKPFDVFLDYPNVFGYIFDALVGTAVIGAEQGSHIYRDLLEILYSKFESEQKLSVSNVYVTEYLLKNTDGFLLNGKNKKYDDFIIFRKDVFERWSSDKNAGYSWHHCYGSWRRKSGGGYKQILKALLGKRIYYWLTHKYCMRNATFRDRYLHDRKISKKGDFVLRNNEIIFLSGKTPGAGKEPTADRGT